jgi:hypothetical protein
MLITTLIETQTSKVATAQTSRAATARRIDRLAVAAVGSTTHNIAAAHPIPTGRQPTNLAARLAAIRWPTAKRARASRLVGREGMSQVIAAEWAVREEWAVQGEWAVREDRAVQGEWAVRGDRAVREE